MINKCQYYLPLQIISLAVLLATLMNIPLEHNQSFLVPCPLFSLLIIALNIIDLVKKNNKTKIIY